MTICRIFVFNDFEYIDIVATCKKRYTHIYIYCQFNGKIAASKLPRVIGFMTESFDLINY